MEPLSLPDFLRRLLQAFDLGFEFRYLRLQFQLEILGPRAFGRHVRTAKLLRATIHERRAAPNWVGRVGSHHRSGGYFPCEVV